MAAAMRAWSPRLAETLPAQVLAAADTQTAVLPGTTAYGRVIAGVAAQLRGDPAERETLVAEPSPAREAHPLAEVSTSMPGLGFCNGHRDPPHRRRRPRVPHRRAPSPPTPASPPSPGLPVPRAGMSTLLPELVELVERLPL